MRAALVLALAMAGCGAAGSDGGDAGSDDLGVDAVVDSAAPDDPVALTVRVVNACGINVDLYVAGSATPLLRDVAPGQVSGWVAATLGAMHGALEVRRAGDAPHAKPLALSDAVMPAAGDRATVALRGRGCAILPLLERFADAPAGTLRVRFVDTVGRDTPTRLFWEQADGSFRQAAAVAAFGDSGAEGALAPAAPAGRDSVRVQVGTELSAGAGAPGYQVPSSLLAGGAHLFVFARLLALWLVGPDGTLAEIRINPSLALLNAVPDTCGSGISRFAFRDAAGRALASIDVRFGFEARLALPPTAGGHTIAVAPGPACSAGPGGEVVAGPLEAGTRYLQVVYGSAASGAPAGSLRAYTAADRVAAGVTAPAIALLNAARAAPALDVTRAVTVEDGGAATLLFGAVGFGALSPWVAAPSEDYALDLVQRPGVTSYFGANQSFLIVALGDFAVPAAAPLKLAAHKLGD